MASGGHGARAACPHCAASGRGDVCPSPSEQKGEAGRRPCRGGSVIRVGSAEAFAGRPRGPTGLGEPPTSRPNRCHRTHTATGLPLRQISPHSARKNVALRPILPGSDCQAGRSPRDVTGLGLGPRSQSERWIRNIPPHSTAIPAGLASKIWQSTPNPADATTKISRSTAGPPRVASPKNCDPTADPSPPTSSESRPECQNLPGFIQNFATSLPI